MKRLYVLTRSDLGISYQAVQGAHAVAQFMIDYPEHEWKNGYLIFLQVEDELELEIWWGELNLKNSFKPDNKKMPMSIFKEADLGNQLTAVAVYSNGTLFRKLPLMQETTISDDQ